MADVLIPNIFITTNQGYIKDFFLNNDSNATVDDLPKANDSLLICAKTNKYLQSFDLSYNLDSSHRQKLTLVFFDTDGQFENNFFVESFNLVKNIMKHELKREALVQMGSVNAESNLADVYKMAQQSERIYVSFGIGNSIQSWSDPLTFYLQKTNVDISNNGLRKYTFVFHPSQSVLFRPRLRFDLDSPNPEREFFFVNDSDSITATTPYQSQEEIDKIKKEANDSEEYNIEAEILNKTNLGKATLIKKKNLQKKFLNDTPSNIIYNLLKKYVSLLTSITEDNIIIILPFLTYAPFVSVDKYFKYHADLFGVNIVDTEIIVNQLLETLHTKKDRNTSVPPHAASVVAEQVSKIKEGLFYVISSGKLQSSVSPGFPDWYGPINKINGAYKNKLQTSDDLVIIEENNSKLLNLWKSKGLIGNENERCIIVGFNRLISQWVYRNQIPGEEQDKNIGQIFDLIFDKFKPDFDIIDCKEKDILSDKKYLIDYLLTVSKRKISSSFSEKIILDELAVNNNEISKRTAGLFSKTTNLLELFDIPVFTNNLKNSNVLDISIENAEIYLNATRLAIRNNFNQFFLTNVLQNRDVINIAGISPQDLLYKLKSYFGGIFEGSTINDTSDPTKRLGEDFTSSEFKKQLREVLLQQFYFAKETGASLNLERTELFKNLEIIEPNRNIKKEINRLTPVGKEYPAGIIYESDKDMEDRVKAATGNSKLYSNKEVRQILNSAKRIIVAFDKLIIKFQGDVDINKLIISYIIGSEIPSVKVSLVNEDTKFLLGGINTQSYYSFSEKEQSRVFDYALLLSYMYNIDMPESEKGKFGLTFTPKEFSLSQENIMAEIFKYQSQNAYNVNIRTLPFFHLSSFNTINLKPAFLFSKKLKTVKSFSNNQDSELDFYSGQYNIVGFRHFISTKECYSEFLMKKITIGAIDG